MHEKGTFQTPFYPLAYPLHRACVWTLEATPGIVAKLTFNKFDLEATPNCTGVGVTIINME